MRFDYVKKIVEKIQQDIVCPKCKKKCDHTPIELSGIGKDVVNFHMACPHCEAHMNIAAELHVTQNNTISRPRPKSHFLSVENMKNMKQSLQNFKGDVRNLFS